MIVFRTFLKVLNKCKAPIIMYTVILVFFGGFNTATGDNQTSFTPSKPDVLIVNNDEEKGITADLLRYIEKNCNIINIKNNEEARNDALFYRDVNYIIYVPDNFSKDLINGNNPEIEIKTTGDYSSSMAEMILERYIKVANIYSKLSKNEDELIENINKTLSNEVEVKTMSKIDTKSIEKASTYYNFANYCLLAGCIYVVCLVLSSFQDEKIKKRTVISSMNYKDYNRKLLFSNSLFAFALWLFYIILSFILVGNVMLQPHGLIYIINSFIFTFCSLTIAFLISNLVSNKDAINGIVNVLALGSSFLCGAFVPMEFLPDSVLKIAHILPSYWYIKTNELLKNIETFNIKTLTPILSNMAVIIVFSVIFIIIANIISNKKRKYN